MPINLSFSSVSMYKDCARKYFLSYLQKLGNPSSPHMTNGTLLHKCAEDFVDWNKEDKTLEKLMEYYYSLVPSIDENNLLHESVNDTLIINPLFEQKAIISLKEVFEDLTQNKFKMNRADNVPNILQQEEWFNIELKDGHKIRGLIDRVDLEDESSEEYKKLDPEIYSPEHIVDYKSGQSRAPFKALSDPNDIRSMQLAIYSLARYKATGRIPYKSSFFYIEPAKNRKKVEGQYRSASPRTLEELLALEVFLNETGNEIQYRKEEQERTGKEMFPMGDNPNCFFCDFKNICPVLAEEQLTEIKNTINISSKKSKPAIEIDVSDWM